MKTLENGAHSAIRSPALLHIRTKDGISYGANQAWYSSWIGRMGGCGPTAASCLLWYLAATGRQYAADCLMGTHGNTGRCSG